MSVGLVYIGLLAAGVAYAAISGAIGWFADLGGGDVHVDASGHLDAGHLHPVSGTTVATFVTGFGGGGTVGHYLFEWPLGGSLPMATLSGLVLAAAAYAVLELILKHTQAGSEFAVAEMTGRDAEVITTVHENGVGEVAFMVKGQRETAPARSTDGRTIAKGKLVVIEKVSGGTVHVRSKN